MFQTGFSSDFAHKISFGKTKQKQKQKQKEADQPTLTLLGMLQETKLDKVNSTPLFIFENYYKFYLKK